MIRYHAEQRVHVFDPKLQHDVPGTVLACTHSTALVALDDRMVPVTVDPTDRHRIHPLEVA